jgi:hypothetical protein
VHMTKCVHRPPAARWGLVAAAAAACALLSSPAAVAAVSAGPPIQVPWLTGINSFNAATTVAVLEDGSFAIAALGEYLVSDTNLATALLAQFFRPDGAPRTRPEILIQSPGVVASVGIGSVGDRYLLFFKNEKRAYARFYSEGGAALGSSIRWPYSDIPYFVTHYRFGGAPLWRFLPITYHLVGHDQDQNPLYKSFVQVADADGLRLGIPVELPVVDAAINGTGRFAVIESPCSGCTLGIQFFDSAVRPLTPLLSAGVPQFLEPDGTQNGEPFAAINNQGQVLVVWATGLEDPAGGHLVARLFNETGTPAPEVIQLSPPSSSLGLVAEPIALADGSFLVAWSIESALSLETKVVMERVDPRTMSVVESLILAEGDLGNQVLDVDSSGKGVFAWQTLNPDNAPNAAYLRVIRVTP